MHVRNRSADLLALFTSEWLIRLSHDAVSDSDDGQRCLQPAQVRRARLSNGVNTTADGEHNLLQTSDRLMIAARRRLVEVHVDPRKQIGSSTNPAVRAFLSDEFRENFFHASKQRELGFVGDRRSA